MVQVCCRGTGCRSVEVVGGAPQSRGRGGAEVQIWCGGAEEELQRRKCRGIVADAEVQRCRGAEVVQRCLTQAELVSTNRLRILQFVCVETQY